MKALFLNSGRRALLPLLFAVVCFCVGSQIHAAEPAPTAFPGDPTDWYGFSRYELQIDGKPVTVVAPEQAAADRPWVWHGEFFGHKPEPDIELLKRGFHIVAMRIPDLFGSPKAVGHWNACYDQMTDRYGLAKQVALVGLSRGGLYCYNWAIANPEKVACIYADAPVCDFKSWPGGIGNHARTARNDREWQKLLAAYGFASDAEAVAYDHNPVDSLASLATKKVPLLHVFGDADEVVPWEDNTGLLATRYRELGGRIWLIQKPEIGHHPHGLDDSTPIVNFIVKHASEAGRSQQPRLRDQVDRRAAKLEPTRQVVYKRVNGRELYLHVFDPQQSQADKPKPCFVIIHGGGWTGGTPQRMYPYAAHFAERGMVGISVEYRLLDPKRGTTVFDCVADGRSAVRFLKSHAADLGIDPKKTTVAGGSAGGHVAAGTALFDQVNDQSDDLSVSPMPSALVLFFPVIDTSKEGYGQAKIGGRWRDLSPVHQVDGDVPPTLIFHGTADTVTPYAGAVAFQKAMRQAENHCELIPHEGGQHGYLMEDVELFDESLEQTEKFLRSLNLMPSDTPPSRE